MFNHESLPIFNGDQIVISKEDFIEEIKDALIDFMQDYESDFDSIEDVLEYTEHWVESRYDG